MKYKSNHNLLLPDGKTEVKAGEVFEYDGDISSFAGIIEPVIEPKAKEKAPKNDENPETKAKEATEEELIRLRGKELKIKNAHNLNIETLKAKIAEAEGKADA